MALNQAAREWLVDKVKRSGVYHSTLELLGRDDSAASAAATMISADDAISRDRLLRAPHRKRRFGLERLASSSGTSGRPLVFPQPLSALQAEQAYIDFLWFQQGFSSGARVLVMRGIAGFKGARSFLNRMVVSADGWKDSDVREKFNALCHFKPEFIDCYPSILERFIVRCCGLGLREFPRVRAVFAGSEACTARQEQVFEGALGAAIVSWYGQSEQVALAVKTGPDEHHLLLNYSDVAFIRHGDWLEIAGRSRLNPYFSTKWYRTGDYCRDGRCGFNASLNMRVMVVNGLSGRSPEYILTKDRNAIPFNHIVFGLHGNFWLAVTRYCFVQETPGLVTFYYSETPGMSAQHLIDRLRARMPYNTELQALHVPELELINDRKWRYFWPSKPPFLEGLGTRVT